MAPRIALQLYTLRDALEADFDPTLRRIAQIGFTHVETAFFPEGISPERARAALDDAGLAVCAAHAALPIGDDRDAVLNLARTLGADTLVWHGWPRDPRYGSRDGVGSLLADYAAAARIASDHGLRLALHNHWWEFDTVDGARTFDRLVESLPASVVFEIDAYWAMVAGVDPVALLRSLGTRAPLVHVKDGPGGHDAPKTALGDGVLPVDAVLDTLSADAWRIVELDDCDTDLFDAVENSLHRLQRKG